MAGKLGVSALALVAAIGLTNSAEAQRRRGLVDVSPSGDRHGFWINFGLGRGEERFKFADEANWSQSVAKPTFSVRLGGTVNPNFRLGGEIIGWSDDGQYDDQGAKITEYLVGGLLVGQFYPSRKAGLFVKGGAGFSRSGVSVAGPGDSAEDGFAWTAGAGYEVKLSRSLFLTPTIDFMQHRSDSRDASGNRLPALYDQLFTIGVGLTIQPGR